MFFIKYTTLILIEINMYVGDISVSSFIFLLFFFILVMTVIMVIVFQKRVIDRVTGIFAIR